MSFEVGAVGFFDDDDVWEVFVAAFVAVGVVVGFGDVGVLDVEAWAKRVG